MLEYENGHNCLTYAEPAMTKGTPRSTGLEAGVFEYVVFGPSFASG